MLLSCVTYCGFAVFPSEEPFLPSPVVALPLEAADLFLHVPEHTVGFQASDHFLSFVGFFTTSNVCVVRAWKAFFAILQDSWYS